VAAADVDEWAGGSETLKVSLAFNRPDMQDSPARRDED